jgi:subtilisin family serine protease
MTRIGATSDAITCIDFAVSKGAKILNNSWGGGGFEQSLFDAINRARVKGVLFVAAAGNEANNNDGSPSYPASYQLDNIISVAAIDRRDNLADFSNFGASSVHLGAPGVDIFSSISSSDTSYDTFSGTSMAAPHVSGVAALILSQFPGATLTEVRGRILSSTVPISSLTGKTATAAALTLTMP